MASVSDLRGFERAGQFGAWLGLEPRQHSSGGKAQLGRITNRGDVLQAASDSTTGSSSGLR